MDLLSFMDTPGTKLLDGAMGTELGRRGFTEGGQNCIYNPGAVVEIHEQYLAVGSQMIITNTLTMNRVYIETHNMDVDVRDVNLAAVSLARSVATDGQFILGDISSTGKMLEPYGEYSEQEFIDTFKEQAILLAEGGVDGFIIETMFDLREALCAVKACREVSFLPVIASIAFTTADRGGRTIMGNSAQECAKQLTEAGVFAVGANCGDLDPVEMADVVCFMKRVTDLHIIAEPNAGKPKLVGHRTVFDLSPEDFARGMSECIEKGATLVGGCCGTTPDHIQALAGILAQ
jgi:5-methyltetrahydrofolate--homocysteine methyltransferase